MSAMPKISIKKSSPIIKKRRFQRFNIDVDNLLNLPGRVNVYWKDTNLRYQACNDTVAEIVNLSNRHNIVGTSDHDLPIEQAPALFRQADIETMHMVILSSFTIF